MNCLPRRALVLQAATATAASVGAVLCNLTAHAQVNTTLVPGVTETDVVQIDSNRYDINGGALSEGTAPNLFHHFLQFDLGATDQVNFNVPTSVDNVIGLIEALTPAQINGLLSLTGAEANLYLVSPSGIVFGPQAQLALPANLMVTTADALLFDEAELAVVQSGEALDPTGLVGAPSAYVFTMLEPAGIENSGSLAVGAGQSLTLLAGNIQNTGTLTAPGGTVNLAAVPGGYTVRLSRPGSLLSLELTPNQPDIEPFSPTPIGTETFSQQSLPVLLTGGSADEVGQIVQNPDGSFSLVGSVTPDSVVSDDGPNFDEIGTVVVQGEINVSSDIGGDISVVAPRVALIGATLTADGTSAGGTIQVGSLPVDIQPEAPQNLDTAYVYVDRATRLSASGLMPESSAGFIYVWADDTTQYYGSAETAGEDGTLFIDAGVTLQRISPPARGQEPPTRSR